MGGEREGRKSERNEDVKTIKREEGGGRGGGGGGGGEK